MDNVYIVLGNGFSLDLVQKMKKTDMIDLNNLFSKGEHVAYPKTTKRGFLSHKYTSSLWELGARSYVSNDLAMQIVTDVITCANVYNLSIEKKLDEERDDSSIYIKAYSELSAYLRYLFIYYDSLVSEEDIRNILDEIELLAYIKKKLSEGKKVYVITYNYDIFLERILKLSDIPFSIYGFDDSEEKVIIYKPHGSISFSLKVKLDDSSPYIINNAISESVSQDSNNFEIKYDLLKDYPPVNAIIPPAGDSERLKYGWIKDIRNGIKDIINQSSGKDEMIMFGISYWHVDRNEIDEILLSMDNKIDIKLINPNPPTALDAVLTSLFKNYVHFSSSNLIMEEIIDVK